MNSAVWRWADLSECLALCWVLAFWQRKVIMLVEPGPAHAVPMNGKDFKVKPTKPGHKAKPFSPRQV